MICGVDIHGLRGDELPKSANQCLMVFDAEGLSVAVDGHQVRQAFSLDYQMDSQTRELEVGRVLGAILEYSREKLTIGDLRAGFLGGELVDGFVHYRAREVLEARTD